MFLIYFHHNLLTAGHIVRKLRLNENSDRCWPNVSKLELISLVSDQRIPKIRYLYKFTYDKLRSV